MQYIGPQISFALWWHIVSATRAGHIWALVTVPSLLTTAAIWYLGRSRDNCVFGVFRPTLPGIFVIANVCTMLLPSAFFFEIAGEDVRYRYLLGVALAPVLGSVGACAAGLAFLKTRRLGFWHQPLHVSPDSERRLRLTVLGCALASVVLVAWYLLTAPYVPLLGSLRGYGGTRPDDVRFAIYRAGDFIIFTYALVNRFLLPVGLLWSYFLARRSPRRIWKWVFVAWFAATLVVALLSFERQNPAAVLAAIGFATVGYARRVPWLRLATLAVGLLVIGGFVSLAQYNSRLDRASLPSAFRTFGVNRVVVDPSYMTWALLEQYPAATPPYLGRTTRAVKLLGVQYAEGLTAIGYLADLWVNFHAVGLFLGPFLIGAFLRAVEETLFGVRTQAREIVHVLYSLATAWLMYTNAIATMTVVVFVFGIGLMWYCDPKAHVRAGLQPVA